MTAGSVQGGPLPEGGGLELLRQVEALRTTGVLRFRGEGRQGEIRLLRGEVAAEQDDLDEDPLEVLLGLQQGQYELIQRLPPLPVSRGDDQHRRGSLGVHAAADLMRYCEQAGLTGELRLTNGERTAQMVYDRGELAGIRVDGSEDADLQRVFGWEEGTFEVEARSLAPTLEAELDLDSMDAHEDPADRDPTIPRLEQRRDPTGAQFLRVVEVALADVLQERESYRPPARPGPRVPPLGDARPRPKALEEAPAAPPRPPREPTVKIVYHSPAEASAQGPPPVSVPPRAHEDPAMTEEHPHSDHDEPPTAEGAPPSRPDDQGAAPRTSALGTAAWIGVVVVLGLLTLRLLALLA